jgi:hypothetical protein
LAAEALMATMRRLQRTLIGGELSERMFGRADDVRYQNGAKRIRNMALLPQGQGERRPGTEFVRPTKDPTKKSRLIPFRFADEDALVVEVGAGYFRFHANGGTLPHGNLRPFVSERTVTFTTGPSGTITTATAHTFQVNDLVRFATTTLLPATLTPGVDYFVVETPAADEIKVSETLNGAPIAYATTGTGTHTVRFSYKIGDTMEWTLGSGFPNGNYYCVQDIAGGATPVNAPSLYWYAFPATGEYEIPNTYTEADLFRLTYDGSLDVLTFTVRSHPPSDLKRFGPLRWTFGLTSIGPRLVAPAGVTATPFRGVGVKIDSLDNTNKRINTVRSHLVLTGDTVYIENLLDNASNFIVPNGDYVARVIDNDTLALSDVTSGDPVTWGAPTLLGSFPGRLYRVSPSATLDWKYRVTAVDDQDIESIPSAEATVTNNLYAAGAYNTIAWGAVPGAVRYRIYKRGLGQYGMIGEVEVASPRTFRDDDIAPDLSKPLPIFDPSLSGTDFPGAVGRFEQRRAFAGTTLFPNTVWLTRSGTEGDLAYSIPLQATDRIRLPIDGLGEMVSVRHIVTLGQMVLLASGGEFRVSPTQSDSLVPGKIQVRPQTRVGADYVRPQVVNNAILFVAARGGHVREMGFNNDVGGFVTGDLSLRSTHLFDGFSVLDAATMADPYPILPFVGSDGLLKCLTYIPEESVGGWQVWETAGEFESVACIPEGGADSLYVVVKRGNQRMVERLRFGMAPLDCALTYSGSAIQTVTGLTVHNGRQVYAIADGVEYGPFTVSGGQIVLPKLASNIRVGLMFTSRVVTLPFANDVEAMAQGRTKNINEVFVRMPDGGEARVRPEGGAAQIIKAQGGILQNPIFGRWSLDGCVEFESVGTKPMSITAIVLEVALG